MRLFKIIFLASIVLTFLAGKGIQAEEFARFPRIIITTFNDKSEISTHQNLGFGLTSEINSKLDRPGIILIIGEELRAHFSTLRLKNTQELNQEDISNLMKQAQADYLVTGQFEIIGGTLKLSSKFYSINEAEPNLFYEKELPLEKISQLPGEIALKLLSKLNIPLTDEEQSDGVKPSTDNFEAFNYFSSGLELVNENLETISKEILLKAASLFEQAYTKDPQFLSALIAKAACYSAIFNISNFKEKNDFEKTAKAIMEHNPKKSGVYVTLAYGYYLLYDYDQSLSLSCKAINLNPQNPNAYIALAANLSNKLRYKEAALAYEKALELSPQSFNAHAGIGGCILQNLIVSSPESTNKAISEFRKALTLYPKCISIYLGLINAYLEQGEREKELQTYQKAMELVEEEIRINPENKVNYLLKGKLLSSQEKYPEAIEGFQKAIKLHPFVAKNLREGIEGDAGLIEAYWQLAKIYNYLKDPDKLNKNIEILKKALPENPMLLAFLGTLKVVAEDYDEAFSDFEAVCRYSPESPMGPYLLSWAYYNKGDSERAELERDKALKLYEQSEQTLQKTIENCQPQVR